MERVMVFIDGSNLYHDWNSIAAGSSMDIGRLVDYVVARKPNRQLKKIYYYNSPISQEDNPGAFSSQQRFFSALSYIPKLSRVMGRLEKRQVKIGESGYAIRCQNCGTPVEGKVYTHVEKGTDINLAVDMLIQAFTGNYDVALLVSRDGDFVRVIEEVKRLGKDVEVVTIQGQKARALLDAADDRIVLGEEDVPKCCRLQ